MKLFLSDDRWRLHAALILILALALRLVLVGVSWTDDLSRIDSGDYALYRIGAEHIRDYGDFSNSLFLSRTPLFPLIIYALGVNPLAVLLVNAILGALIAPLTYVLARQTRLSAALALAAGLIVAVDPASLRYSVFLGTEPSANLMVAAMMAALLAGTGAATRRRAIVCGLVAGVALVLALLARPSNYLLWTGLGLWLLVAYRRQWVMVVAFVAVSVAGMSAWTIHNGLAFGNYTVSTVGTYTMVYYHAASVEHLATGHDMDTVYTTINRRIETLLGHDPSLATPDYMHRYLSATPDVEDALNAVAFEIFRAHPLVTLLTLPIGFARMYGLTGAAVLTDLLGGAPEIAWNALLLGGSGLGLWLALRRRQWRLFWPVFLMMGYFTAGTLLVKTAGSDARERMVLTPFMAMAAVYGADLLWQWLVARGRSIEQGADFADKPRMLTYQNINKNGWESP